MSQLTYPMGTAQIDAKPAVTKGLKGVGTAIVTPFDADLKVDLESLGRLVDAQLAGGVDFLVPVGTTGECPTLTHEEHELVIKFVVERVAGRVPVVAGTGSNNTQEAISLTRFAKKVGADAVLMVNPYYNKPSQKGLELHFKAIAEAVDIPIVLYNIPSRTGITMQPETVAALWNAVPNIVAIKEATGSLDIASKIKELCPIPILSGDDTLTLPLMSIGGCGVISVLSNIAPGIVKSIVDNSTSGNSKEAGANHVKYHRLMRTMFIDVNPVPVKVAAKMLSIINTDAVRLPLGPIEPQNKKVLVACLQEYGLISQ